MHDSPPLDLERLLGALTRHGVEFVVIGGLAVIAHGHERATFDFDVCHKRTQQNARCLLRALRELGAQVRHGDRLLPLPGDFRVLRSSESIILRTNAGDLDCVGLPDGTSGYDDLVRHAWSVPYAGAEPLVASLDDLIRMKEASGRKARREKDRSDLKALRLIQREQSSRTSAGATEG